MDSRALKEWGETQKLVDSFSLQFFCALANSYVLYSRTVHCQGFSICEIKIWSNFDTEVTI